MPHIKISVMIAVKASTVYPSGNEMTHVQLRIADIETKQAKPFLKWAGGKSQLLSQFENLFPAELKQGKIERYVEPFIGGGAVFFEIVQKYKISSAFLYDINSELILVYKVVQKDPERLIEQLKNISQKYKALRESRRKTFYYELREKYNLQRLQIDYQRYSVDWISRAAILIFLNRTCFNGLFRLNSRGEFNVPHGRYKNPRILDEENLMAVSRLLQIAEIQSGDFEVCEGAVTSNTFIYFDPPYRPISKTANFTSYSKSDFNDPQQIRLANFFRYLHTNYDVRLMLSNSDPKNENPSDDFFEDLYKGFNIHRVSANRMINSNPDKRGQINELVITNYEVNMRNRDYIPVEKHWFDMYTRNFKMNYWTPKLRVPISRIKIDKKLFSYQNQISKQSVQNIVSNFDRELWMPITVNKELYLLDGQHRLAVAKQLGLNYVDVVIQDTDLLNTA